MAKKRRHRKRRRLKAASRTTPGAAPGTLVADPEAPAPAISVMAYSLDKLTEDTITDPHALKKYTERWPVTWVNVDGLGDVETIKAIAATFDLHPLALEDVVHTHQRPKLEEYRDQLFLVTRMPQLEEGFRSEQVSLFVGPNYIVTFQERPGDCFQAVRKRIREGPRTRLINSDYLAYALIDAMIDSYFPVLETFGERLDRLEEEIERKPTAEVLGRIHDLRHELLALRRSIWPARDTLNSLVRDPNPLIKDTTRMFLRDCYDHAVRIIDLVETYRELSSGLTEYYQSTVGHRMNEIMKVLTVIATIFIPLTFVAGIYGMNFNTERSPWNMPELNWYWGYPLALSVMALIVVGMIVYFRRKGWLNA